MATSTFVPAGLVTTKWENIEPLAKALLDRPVRTRDELERWLLDRSELDAACSEGQAMLYINMTCDTEDAAAQKAYTDYVENVAPKMKPVAFELDKKQTTLSRELGLAEAGAAKQRYEVLVRDVAVDVDLFRPENVPLETELALLAQKYDQIAGAMSVNFDGREQTLPQMGRYMELTDRSKREGAWRAVAARRLQDREAIEEIYDKLIGIRDRVARNAGFKDFVGYAYKSKHRFDYGVEHCRAFHDACEKAIVPLIRRLDRQRKASLKLDTLRPWDLAVDVKGRGPLRPFTDGRDLVSKSVATFERLDPRLGKMLATLGDGANTNGARGGASLDLDSRKGKAPGGYQYMLDRQRRPFIFMNAAGLQKDVSTMLHEAGHAFHSMLCVQEPLLAYRSSPIEFAEVASMTMELLTMPHWGKSASGGACFYTDDVELARARRHQLEDSIVLLPWIATIDAFQHWIYANPKHTREERKAFWLSLDARFGHEVDWTGLESERAFIWHRQKHVFDYPFYYIEYGIAQLGALGLWVHSLEKGEKSAVEAYVRGLSLGGSRPLPELFRAAGLEFDFGESNVKRIVERVERELEKLPE